MVNLVSLKFHVETGSNLDCGNDRLYRRLVSRAITVILVRVVKAIAGTKKQGTEQKRNGQNG